MTSSSVFDNNEPLKYVLQLFEKTISNHGLYISNLQVSAKPGAILLNDFTPEQTQMVESLSTLARLPPYSPTTDPHRAQSRLEYRDAYVERATNLFCKILSTLHHNLVELSLGEHPHRPYAEAAPSLPPAPRPVPYDVQRRVSRLDPDVLDYHTPAPSAATASYLPDAVFPRLTVTPTYRDVHPPLHKVERLDRMPRRLQSFPYTNEPLRRRRSRDDLLSYSQWERNGDLAASDGVYNSFAVSRKDFRDNGKYDGMRPANSENVASRLMGSAESDWVAPPVPSAIAPLQRRTHKRGSLQKGEDKSERQCANCKTSDTRQWVRGKDNWLCHSCGQFWRKNGYSRPRALWNRPTFKRAPRKASSRGGGSGSKPRRSEITQALRIPGVSVEHRYGGGGGGGGVGGGGGGGSGSIKDEVEERQHGAEGMGMSAMNRSRRIVEHGGRLGEENAGSLEGHGAEHTNGGQEVYNGGENGGGVDGVPPLSGLFYSAAMMRSNTT